MTTLLKKIKLSATTCSAIGLDVGPTTIRAAQLERDQNRWVVTRLAQWSRRDSEAGLQSSDGFAKRIRRALIQADYQGRRVLAGLSVPELEVHALEVPNRGDMESSDRFGEALAWELRRVMNVAADDSALSYWRVPPSQTTRTTAIGVAAKKQHVQAVNTLVAAMGLDCECVDATACALARVGTMLRTRADVEPNSIWGVLDVGQRMMRLAVCVNHSPVLVRALGNGGAAWTQSIAAALGVSEDAAEFHKRDHGIAASNAISTADSAKNQNQQADEIAVMIQNILSHDLNQTAQEIERSYEYVMRCYPERNADELILVGGGAATIGLDRFLAQKLGIKVRSLDSIIRDQPSALTVAAHIRESLDPYAAAIGLAIEEEMIS